MEIFNMKRGTGKTTLLIILSHFTNARIITTTERMVKNINDRAKQLKLSIPEPKTYIEYKRLGFSHKEKILIDDLDYMLNSMFCGQEILAVTLTEE